jgi:hypothetical protein
MPLQLVSFAAGMPGVQVFSTLPAMQLMAPLAAQAP